MLGVRDFVPNNAVYQDVPRELTRDFEALLFEYLKAFKVWKEPDELKLTLRIKHALRAVYQGLANRPTHEPEDSQIRNEYRAQVERLRNKLAHIAGQEALAQFDAENEQWLQQQVGCLFLFLYLFWGFQTIANDQPESHHYHRRGL